MLAGLFLLYLSIRLVPVQKWTFLLLSASPMVLHQMASLSPDALVIGSSFLGVAAIARLALQARTADRRSLILVIVLSAIVGATKPVLLLPLLFLIVPLDRIGSKRRYWLLFSIVTTAFIIGVVTWPFVLRSEGLAVPWRAGTDPLEQACAMATNPVRFLHAVMRDYFVHARTYTKQMLGEELGWLDTRISPAFIKLHFLALVLSAVLGGREGISIRRIQRLVIGAALLLGLLAVSTILYLYNADVGATSLRGIQGRYFLPLSALPVLLLHNQHIPAIVRRRTRGALRSWHCGVAYLFYSVTLSAVACGALLQRYYGV